MKTETVALQRTDSVGSFIALVSSSVKDLVESANMLVRLRANDEDVLRKITEIAPEIPASFLANLVRVGEGSLHPSIMLNGCPAYRRLAALPFSSQESALKSGRVPVVIDAATGEALNVPLVDLSPAQVGQVFSQTGTRNKDEQQAFMRRKQIATAQSAQIAGITGAPYSIRGKAVFCNAGCVLTQQDLIRLLGEMAK
jgi:hypothetical protein